MKFDNNSNQNDALNFAKRTQEALTDGWYTVRLIGCSWWDGRTPGAGRMSFRFRVLDKQRDGKVFQANLSWGLIFTAEDLTRTLSDASSMKKLAIIYQIAGLQMEGLDDSFDVARLLNGHCKGNDIKMRVQVRFFSTDTLEEGYNLIQVSGRV